jgi:hypothetical protein
MLFPWAASAHNPPTSTSRAAGITGMYHPPGLQNVLKWKQRRRTVNTQNELRNTDRKRSIEKETILDNNDDDTIVTAADI